MPRLLSRCRVPGLLLVRHKGFMNQIIVLAANLALVAGFASAQPGSSNLDTGKELVAQLYKEHSGKSDPLQYPASKKRLPNYFYKPLLDLYLKDQEASKGEVGKIDFDLLYDAQDFEISDFNLVVLPNKKGSGYVAARFKNMGIDQEITFALQRTKMGWRIADIQYKDGRSLWKILRDRACTCQRHAAATRRCGAAELRTLDVPLSDETTLLLVRRS